MSLDALTDRLFDHAGMFPPAALGLDDALAVAARFPDDLRRPDMVQNDMVLTPEHWRTLSDERFAAAGFKRPCRICLVGIDVDEAADVLREAQEWNDVGGVARPARVITTLEMHIPPNMALGTAVGRVTAGRYLAGGGIDLYVEPKWDDATWNARMDDLMEMFDDLNADVELPPVGLKFRAWGDTALSPDTVARLIPVVDERAIPLKATQGLHHPLVEGHEQNAMGFVGLAAALRLCDATDMDHDDRVALLTESDPAAFDFSDGVAWRDHHADLSQLDVARVPFSIGSCSLSEPDDDLARLFSDA